MFFLILISQGGCNQIIKPTTFGLTRGMKDGTPEGTPNFRAGWKDGCKSGMAAYGNSYLRVRYITNVKPQMMRHPLYSKGWELGQRYCSYYSSIYLANTEMAYLSNDKYTKSDSRSDNT